jgi:hypothetical protein
MNQHVGLSVIFKDEHTKKRKAPVVPGYVQDGGDEGMLIDRGVSKK